MENYNGVFEKLSDFLGYRKNGKLNNQYTNKPITNTPPC